MPKYSYDTYADLKKESTNKKERKVGYFKLKPGEKALVRFAYETPQDFEIVTVHEAKVQDKVRTILCLRNAKDDISVCPLCANGTPLKARFYAKLLRYTTDENGNVTVSPETANWSKKYADTLRVRFQEYGNLCDCLFVVTRIGTGVDTSYDIQYANPVKYSEANGYVKDFSAFEDFDLSPHCYTERNKEDIEEFLQTGDFPMRKKEGATGVGTVMPPVPEDDEMPVDVKLQANTYSFKPKEGVTITQETPVQQKQEQPSDFTFNRPRRTYDIQ